MASKNQKDHKKSSVAVEKTGIAKAMEQVPEKSQSDEIRAKFEAKLAELQQQRAPKNPERAAKRHRQKEQKKARKAAAIKTAKQANKPEAAQSPAEPKTPTLILPKIVDSKADKNRIVPKDPLPKNPKQALQKLAQRKERLAALPPSEQATRAKDETWARAIQRAQGAKVRDNPHLLQRAAKRQEKQKTAKARAWQERKSSVDYAKKKKQVTRQDNITKRQDKVKEVRMEKRRKRR